MSMTSGSGHNEVGVVVTKPVMDVYGPQSEYRMRNSTSRSAMFGEILRLEETRGSDFREDSAVGAKYYLYARFDPIRTTIKKCTNHENMVIFSLKKAKNCICVISLIAFSVGEFSGCVRLFVQ